MRRVGLCLFLFGSAFVSAQDGETPYAVDIGMRVRISTQLGIEERNLETTPLGYIGYVETYGPDTLVLVPREDRGATGEQFPWAEITRVERYGENRTGEALGILIGGVSGGLIGYVGGDALLGEPFGKGLVIYGGFLGFLAGGVIGAHVGDRWHEVPPR